MSAATSPTWGGIITASGTITFLGAATTLTWVSTGTTSNTGCCWQGEYVASNGHPFWVQIVCSSGCTAVLAGGSTVGGWAYYQSSVDCDGNNDGSSTVLSIVSSSCSPIGIHLRGVTGGGGELDVTITP